MGLQLVHWEGLRVGSNSDVGLGCAEPFDCPSTYAVKLFYQHYLNRGTLICQTSCIDLNKEM